MRMYGMLAMVIDSVFSGVLCLWSNMSEDSYVHPNTSVDGSAMLKCQKLDIHCMGEWIKLC